MLTMVWARVLSRGKRAWSRQFIIESGCGSNETGKDIPVQNRQ